MIVGAAKTPKLDRVARLACRGWRRWDAVKQVAKDITVVAKARLFALVSGHFMPVFVCEAVTLATAGRT